MTFYIIADDDSIGVLDAIKKNEMMNDHRWKLLFIFKIFWVGNRLSFNCLYFSVAKFYEDIKDKNVGICLAKSNSECPIYPIISMAKREHMNCIEC